MRYYVLVIQQTPSGENRSTPKAFDTKNDAVAEFHSQLAKDMKNTNVTSSIVMLIDSDGAVHRSEKYVADATPTETQTE